jgi:hypothetical protein
MMNKSLTFLLLLSLLLAACSGSQEFGEQEAQKEIVMKIHDEVMPKMSNIYELQKQLDEVLKPKMQATEADSAAIGKIFSLKDQLKSADDAMMQWMRDFSKEMAPPGDAETYQQFLQRQGISHQEYMKFLAEEEEKIREVKEKMLTSIADAQQFLEK